MQTVTGTTGDCFLLDIEKALSYCLTLSGGELGI